MEARVASSMPSKVSNCEMSYAGMKERSRRMQPIHVAHGGRVYEAARRWGIEPHQVLDFSANINPLGPPLAVLSAIEDALTPFSLRVYPDAHNFSAALYPRDALLSLIDAAEEYDSAVLLDEAFIDYAQGGSVVSLAATKSHLIVLRSLTKFYAIPGIRIGYAVSNAKIAARVKSQIDPWSVSTVALEAGCAALHEDEFDVESCRINAIAREEFADALRGIGLEVLPSAANFLLAKLPNGSRGDLQSWLEPERILIRRCDSFHGLGASFIRLAVRPSSDNGRLVCL